MGELVVKNVLSEPQVDTSKVTDSISQVNERETYPSKEIRKKIDINVFNIIVSDSFENLQITSNVEMYYFHHQIANQFINGQIDDNKFKEILKKVINNYVDNTQEDSSLYVEDKNLQNKIIDNFGPYSFLFKYHYTPEEDCQTVINYYEEHPEHKLPIFLSMSIDNQLKLIKTNAFSKFINQEPNISNILEQNAKNTLEQAVRFNKAPINTYWALIDTIDNVQFLSQLLPLVNNEENPNVFYNLFGKDEELNSKVIKKLNQYDSQQQHQFIEKLMEMIHTKVAERKYIQDQFNFPVEMVAQRLIKNLVIDDPIKKIDVYKNLIQHDLSDYIYATAPQESQDRKKYFRKISQNFFDIFTEGKINFNVLDKISINSAINIQGLLDYGLKSSNKFNEFIDYQTLTPPQKNILTEYENFSRLFYSLVDDNYQKLLKPIFFDKTGNFNYENWESLLEKSFPNRKISPNIINSLENPSDIHKGNRKISIYEFTEKIFNHIKSQKLNSLSDILNTTDNPDFFNLLEKTYLQLFPTLNDYAHKDLNKEEFKPIFNYIFTKNSNEFNLENYQTRYNEFFTDGLLDINKINNLSKLKLNPTKFLKKTCLKEIDGDQFLFNKILNFSALTDIQSKNLRYLLQRQYDLNQHFGENTSLLSMVAYKNGEINFDKLSTKTENIYAINDFVEKLSHSPSRKLQIMLPHIVQMAIDFTDKQTDVKKYFDNVFNHIDAIFTKNNVPEITLSYNIFKTFYPENRIVEETKSIAIINELKKPEYIYQLIYKDLLKSYFLSGNVELTNYLKLFSENTKLLDNYNSETSHSNDETKQLSAFIVKLNSLFYASFKNDSIGQYDSNNIPKSIKKIRSDLHVSDNETIENRMATIFLRPLGFSNFDEALKYQKELISETEKRRLSLASQKSFNFEAGDHLKGVNYKDFYDILNKGCLSKEYISSETYSKDSTPFGTDFGRIKDLDNDKPTFHKIVLGSVSHSVGDITLVIKNRNQFNQFGDTINNYAEYLSDVYKGSYDQHYDVRTAISSSEIDCVVVRNNDINQELLFTQIAQKNSYLPVFDEYGQLIFTPEDFNQYRKIFFGIERFGNDNVNINLLDDAHPYRSTIDKIKKEINTENSSLDIFQIVKEALRENNIKLNESNNQGLIGAYLDNIGSTVRGTNAPANADHDYCLIVNYEDYKKKSEIAESLKKLFHAENIESMGSKDEKFSQYRLIACEINGMKQDIDININTIATASTYGSHLAVKDKLSNIQKIYGEEVKKEVVANIILAKEILKEGECYKKGTYGQGGLGGIGVENWIIQNNGNIMEAFGTFWNASHPASDKTAIPFEQFVEQYFIIDPGINLRDGTNFHDNFVRNNMTKSGYEKMIQIIGKYLNKL